MWHDNLITGECSWETVLETTLASAAQFSSLVTGEGSGLAPVLACFLLIFFPFSSLLDLFASFLFFFPCLFCFLVAKFDFAFFFPLPFFFFFVALVNSEACGFFKGKSMTRKVEAWREEALEGPGRGNLDQALCHPLRREGRVTARVESKAGIWGRRENGRVAAPGSYVGRASRMQWGLAVALCWQAGLRQQWCCGSVCI